MPRALRGSNPEAATGKDIRRVNTHPKLKGFAAQSVAKREPKGALLPKLGREVKCLPSQKSMTSNKSPVQRGHKVGPKWPTAWNRPIKPGSFGLRKEPLLPSLGVAINKPNSWNHLLFNRLLGN